MFKKIAISLLLVLAAIIAALQIDDDLHPEAAIWIKQVNANADSQAYYYLMGIFASSDEDPLDIGLQRYQTIQAHQEKLNTNNNAASFEDYPDEKKIQLPTGELFCKYWEEGCLQSLLKSDVDRQALLPKHSVLLQRYQKFMEFEEFHTMTKPELTEPLSPFQYLSAGHRLESLMLLDNASEGKQKETIADLSSKITKLKDKIKLQDTIVGKTVFLHMLSESIDLFSIITNIYKMPIAKSLTLISVAERDFYMPIQREFYMGYDMYQNLDRNPEFFHLSGNMPGWIVRGIFKPNMTSNSSFLMMADVVNKSRLDQKEFAQFIASPPVEVEPKYSLRNYAGDVLNQVAKPNFMEYIARFHDLNCKIVLFNNMSKIKEKKFDIIKNPYGLNDRPKISTDGSKICFDGPFEDGRNFRCLMVEI